MPSEGAECPAPALLALQCVQHGYEYARATLVQAFWGAIWEAEDRVDSAGEFAGLWNAIGRSESILKPLAKRGKPNVAQYILCLVFEA